MALQAGVSVGVQAFGRAVSPSPAALQNVKLIAQAMAETTQIFRQSRDKVHQCWDKLTKSEQLAADMVDKIMITTRRVEQLNDTLQSQKAAVAKKRKLCDELREITEFSSSRLGSYAKKAEWNAYHTVEMDRRVAGNTEQIEDLKQARGTLHSRLRDILVELKSVKIQLEDADESVRYIEKVRGRFEEEQEEEILSLKAAIKEAYVTRNTMMSFKPDAMSSAVQQLLPSDEEYEQLVAETEDLTSKCSMLKSQLQEQSKEMLLYHSKNYELSMKIKELAAALKEERQKSGWSTDENAHAQTLQKPPITWFEAPITSIEAVKDYLIRHHGRGNETRVVEYLDMKARRATRWHSQMFEKDFTDYDKTLEILAEKVWNTAGKEDLQVKDGAGTEENAQNVPTVAPATDNPAAQPLTESELQLCAALVNDGRAGQALVDNIDNRAPVNTNTSRTRFMRRLQRLFRR
ncbi:hyaluronan mediated motility receptor-like [Haliotis cracherodii]|uniref:hyaluronan mediated motility receptor-like n=1 Tax=Haliotis cracherodii TaxID=6455 RepID=UPI0039EB8302